MEVLAMPAVQVQSRGAVATATVRSHAASEVDLAFERFLLERRGLDLSPATITFYRTHLGQFFAWLAEHRPDVVAVEQLDKDIVVAYRVHMTERGPMKSSRGTRLSPETLQASQRALRTFFGWCQEDGYRIDERVLRLRKTRVPAKEATVFTVDRVRRLLDVCDGETERTIVRLLIGSGVRKSEAVGLSFRAPDGLSDLSTDAVGSGWAELRVRWDAGAKGRKARRVPISPKLALALKRYQARFRPQSESSAILLSSWGRLYHPAGLDSVMDRLERRAGFRVHCHAFRHTFATVQAKAGRSLEHLRAAMGHEDYDVLFRYVKLASALDLGPLTAWEEFMALPHPGQYR